MAAAQTLATIYRDTENTFSNAMKRFEQHQNDDFRQTVRLFGKELDAMIDQKRDVYLS